MNRKNIFVIEAPKALSEDVQLAYFKRLRKGDLSVREELINHNIRLVIHIVKNKFYNASYDMDDLISEGIIGLMNAVDTFDYKITPKFSTYASKTIENQILMLLRKPVKNDISLEATINSKNEKNNLTFKELIKDENINVEEELLSNDLSETIIRLIDEIEDDMERDIVRLSFGFGCKRVPQRVLAEKYKVSQPTISRIFNRSVRVIAYKLETMGLINISSEQREKLNFDELLDKDEPFIKKICKTIYQYFDGYTREEVNYVISLLNDEEKKIIYMRYGEDLDNPLINKNFNKEVASKLYCLIIPKMKNRLKRIKDGKDIKETRTFYSFFEGYTKDEVKEAIGLLASDEREIIYLKYGNDLENTSDAKKIDRKMMRTINASIVPKIRVRLERMKNGKDMFSNINKRFVQNIYECLKGYTEEEVDAVIGTLSKEDMDVLHIRYGEDLRSNTLSENWHSKYNYDFYNKLIPKMKRRLEKMRINGFNGEGLDSSKKIESSSSESFGFLKESEIKNIFSLLEPYKAFIIGLRFGYVDGKCYSVEEISEKLKISPKIVIKNIRDGLITYRNLVSKNVEDEIESMNDEVMKLNFKKESSN